MSNLVWFRNDLRVYDNPALFQAMSKGPCIAVYFITDDQWDDHGLSQIKRQLIVEHLKLLEQSLAVLNVPLIVIDGRSFSHSTKLLLEMCNQHEISAVYFNHEYGVNEKRQTTNVELDLKVRNINSHGFNEQCIITPGSIKNGQGESYKVFSAFKRKWYSDFVEQARPLYTKPKAQSSSLTSAVSNLECLKDYDLSIPLQEHWLFNESQIHDYLTEFAYSQVDRYHLERDIPSLNSTSRLSTHLALGVITTRQCLQAILETKLNSNTYSLDLLHEGAQCWVNELIWRDFYRHILVAFPRISKGKAFKQETEKLPWKSNNQDFLNWCQGLTGIPIIDAAMRQLNQTGWMHNRLRMVTAMYLTKHLHIDWRLGEQYFYSKLADADLASNNGGWQWSASTGVDAVPYFRIFNPYRQAERFDPNGDFVRKYVKELNSIKGKAIHKPDKALAIELNYPMMTVDLKIEADKTKSYFKALKQ